MYNDFSDLASNAASNPSSSSKAVLAALRALQDKIRRLESERSQALDEVAQLRHQLKNQEIEAENIKQRESLTAQKNLQEVRNAYDRLLSEKTELEMRLPKLEERNRSSQIASEELQAKIRALEDEKLNNSHRLKELEYQHQQLEIQIQHTQQKEKDLAQSMIWETKRHEGEITSLHKRVQLLQDELSHACHEKGASDAKLLELDQLVAQLLSVNESLVAQLSGKPASSRARSQSPAPPTRKTKKSSKKNVVPRAATLSTVSIDSYRNSRPVSKKISQLIPVKTDDIEHLKNMHKIYSDMARNIGIGNEKSSGGSGSGKKKSNDSGNAASSSKKKTTRLARKKAELIEKFQEDASNRYLSESMRDTAVNGFNSSTSRYNNNSNHHSDAANYYSDSEIKTRSFLNSTYSNNGSSGINNTTVRVPRPVVSFDHDLDASREEEEVKGGAGEDSLLGGINTTQDFNSYLNTSNNNNNTNNISSSNNNNNARYNKINTSLSNSATYHKNDLQHVISTLEEEFDALNVQYRKLLTNVHDTSASSSILHGGSNDNHHNSGGDNIQAQAEEIVNVIQKLHQKGEQLRALKSPQK